VRTGGAADIHGGGAFSGRLTAPLCFAGSVARQLLARRGVQVYAHIASVGGVCDALPDFCRPDAAALAAVQEKAFPVLDDAAGEAMKARIAAAQAQGDSVGGSIRCIVTGLPAGLGAHMFDGVENRISAAVFGIPGVRGIEFGSGFAGCESCGTQFNDPYMMETGAVRTAKNDAGGVLGGSTTGMPLVFRLALRPTPTVAQPQHSVDLAAGENTTLTAAGRHDPCILPRAVPAVEAVAALAVLDLLLDPPAVW
jgi:chorismate synthase